MNLENIERLARYVMGSVALVAGMAAVLVTTGLIGTAPSYERDAWYLISEHDGFVVTRLVSDEATCRKREQRSKVCRSGKTLIEQQQTRKT